MLPKFFLANDASDEKRAMDNAEAIAGVCGDYGIKINLDLAIKDFTVISRMIKKTNRPIFVDMKMWNGKRTMNEVIKAVAGEGATMVNVWALADSILDKATATAKELGLIVLGVTVLTHYNNDYCRKFYHQEIDELVRLLAETALERGCDGYILPGTTLSAVTDLGGIKFNPAVRPAWFKDKKANYQEQILTERESIENGATIVSCGSPVFKSPDPHTALKRILDEIDAVYASKI